MASDVTGRIVAGLFLALMAVTPKSAPADSTCFGTTAAGSLSDGCKLPSEGSNFESYSILGSWLGRTWVHCTVAQVVTDAYNSVSRAHPATRWVYGETGLKSGGEFEPHKTHRNGLSVDFMVPVVNAQGKPESFPGGLTNKFGYSLEFDDEGGLEDLRIDFEAIVAHLEALRASAAEAGIGIQRVIFDPELQPFLRESPRWAALEGIQFSKRRSWVRHDEHYHVDFDVACEPFGKMQ